MKTSTLKTFAQEARVKLIAQVGARLELVLGSDSAILREKAEAVAELKKAIKASSKDQVIDKVAYTWFNRLVALRFMDANDYQPIGVRVLTPKAGYTLPELLDEAKQGHIPEELPVVTKHVYDLLEGRIPSANAQNEAYKELLIGACNHLHALFPFLFEALNNHDELLLPDDLISEFSIVHDVCAGMSEEDCQQVEVIGWLYQFYISEEYTRIRSEKRKWQKNEIGPATQFFTPRWIVEYMVQNTVGKLWLQNKPHSKLRAHMPYFIESPSVTAEDHLVVSKPEELTLLDSACGSGHILVYGFELLSKIYEEEGYAASEIPQLIITHNLFGFEIDARAAQLAGCALMMQARSYHKRFFRKAVKPNILCFQDLDLTPDEVKDTCKQIGLKLTDELVHDLGNMRQATNFGSLIIPHTLLAVLHAALKQVADAHGDTDAFLTRGLMALERALEQLVSLARKYHCVVDNPPYMGSGNMNGTLLAYVKANYPNSSADLMACFMEAGLEQLQPRGFLGMINQHSWMFIDSYKNLRRRLIDQILFDSLLHLGPHTFPEMGGEVVQNSAFTVCNTSSRAGGVFIRLVAESNPEGKRVKTLTAIHDRLCGWYYTRNPQDFIRIPGCAIAYWIDDAVIEVFSKAELVGNLFEPRTGMNTGDNSRFVREWFEVQKSSFNTTATSVENAIGSNYKWFPYNKGGGFVKWYGNRENIIAFDAASYELLKDMGNNCPSEEFYFQESIGWSKISTGKAAFRAYEGFIIDGAGSSVFGGDYPRRTALLGLLNSAVTNAVLEAIAPTLNFQVGSIKAVPVMNRIFDDEIVQLVERLVESAKVGWNTSETSWDFLSNELTRIHGHELEDSYEGFRQVWRNKFITVHEQEELLNRMCIAAYELDGILSPVVPLDEITILQEVIDRRALGKHKYMLKRDHVSGLVSSYEDVELPFDKKAVIAQYVSYSVGCMFGRYSLDREGFILANQGETLKDYLKKVGKEQAMVTLLPDEDNIIPVLDDEWFEDDIVGRFHEFLKATFGKPNFEKNLAFVEECLGKDIRKYFVKDFYADHIKRYSTRPIYWMFSSPKGAFNVLVYMHRYTPDTLNRVLNNYLKEYREKLNTRTEHLDHLIETGSASQQTKAAKEKDKLKAVLLELQEYERDILYPLATERIAIDLDDGVLVNYNKFGKAIKEVAGLNDKKTKDKVKKFDWIDMATIR